MDRPSAVSIASLLILGLGWAATAQEPPPPQPTTPPRLSLVDGPTSFWRPGAEDWAPAQVNTPLAAGDFVYTGSGGNVEIQIGPRAFVRAAEDTNLQLSDIEADYIQLKLSGGQASLDLHEFTPGHSIEVDTPNAALTIERGGYYRFNVGPQSTALITRRGGSATLTPADGQPVAISPAEEVIISADESSAPAVYSAPEPDVWDSWNSRRTEYLVDSMSARYVPPGVYGAADLDHYGAWRRVPDYGPVWIPSDVPAGWAPYSAGRWVYDPVFGWTWVDTEPWGWAPFHYGRWVSVNGFWAWAPGPAVAQPAYAPALVGWLGGGGVGVGVGLGWVALGWGEPVVPWWGPREFVGHPYWGGWGGPRVVNRTVVTNVTNVNVTNITYANTEVHNAVLTTSTERFGRAAPSYAHVPPGELNRWHAAEHGVDVKPTAVSLVPGEGRAVRPPREVVERPVVATREVRHEPLAAVRQAGIQPAEHPGNLPRPVAPTIIAKPQPSERPAAREAVPGAAGHRPQAEGIERRPSAPPPSFNTLREQQPPARGQGPVATTRAGPAAPTAPGTPGPGPSRSAQPRPEQQVVAPPRPAPSVANVPPRNEPQSRATAPPSAPTPQAAFTQRGNLPGVPAMQVRQPPVQSHAPASPAHPSGNAPAPHPSGQESRDKEHKGQ